MPALNLDTMQRLDVIKARVQADGRVKITDLAADLDVSEMTIRRDLQLLVDQGAVQKVRGGASALGPQSFARRYGRNAGAKDRIARKLSALIGEEGAVGIDASSTLQRAAGVIDAARDLTVITNGPDLFASLQDKPGVTALLTGGQLDRRTGSLIGPLAVRSARDLLLRRLFVSAAGIDPEFGTSEATLEEADVKLALADVAAEVVVALDHSKLGQRGVARALALDRVDILVTDLDPGDARLTPYRDKLKVL